MPQPTTPTEPTVDAPVVITAGLPFELTWDDRPDRHLGIEGTLVAINRDFPAPYEVRAADGRTLHAGKVRVIDDEYLAWKEQSMVSILTRRLQLLEERVVHYAANEDMPGYLASWMLDDIEQGAATAWAMHY